MRAGSLAGGVTLLILGLVLYGWSNSQLNASDFRASVAACSAPLVNLLPQCDNVQNTLTMLTTASGVAMLFIAAGLGIAVFGVAARSKTPKPAATIVLGAPVVVGPPVVQQSQPQPVATEVPLIAPPPPPQSIAQPQQRFCPTCGARWSVDFNNCPKEGAVLKPLT